MKIAFFLLLSLVIAHVIANKKARNAEEERCSLDSAGFVKKTIYFEDQSHLIDQEQRVALQGRPGKTGAKGQKGDVGPAGIKGRVGKTGERGICSCAVTDDRFEEMQTTQQEVVRKNEEMSLTIRTLQQEVEGLKVFKARQGCLDKGGLLFGDKCFFVMKTKAQRFSDAKNLCTQDGGQLASITSTELYQALMNFIRPQMETLTSRYYINIWTNGRYDPITGDNRITWSDGTKTSYGGWKSSYPYTGSSYSTYTHIYLQVWKDPTSAWNGFLNDPDNWNSHPLCSY